MENPIIEQYLIGTGCIVLGMLGWLLPYRWNILRFHRSFARLLSESANMKVPKVIGSICILAGLGIVIGTALCGKFDSPAFALRNTRTTSLAAREPALSLRAR